MLTSPMIDSFGTRADGDMSFSKTLLRAGFRSKLKYATLSKFSAPNFFIR